LIQQREQLSDEEFKELKDNTGERYLLSTYLETLIEDE
jgi:hypothetical protein